MASAAGATPPATAALAPELALLAYPTELRPVDIGRVVVRVQDLGVCRLNLRLDRGPLSTSSLVRPAGKAELTWEWTVPATVRAARWRGRVECWQANVPSQTTQPVVERFEGHVTGRPHGTEQVADRDLITAAVDPLDGSSLLDRGASLATIVAAAIGILTLPLILLSLIATRRGTRSARTATITDRYIEDTFTKAWDKVKPYLVVADEVECVDRIQLYENRSGNDKALGGANGPSPNDVDAVIWLHELIGALFNRGEIDRRLVYRTFSWPSVDTLSSYCWWWLLYLRDGHCVPVRPHFVRPHESETYAEWERMARMILRKRPDLRLRVQSAAENPVRALCLPRGGGKPPDWGHCKVLSRAVGELLRRPGGLGVLRTAIDRELERPVHATAIEELSKVPPPTRTILIPAWEERAAAPWCVTAHVARLGAWLDGRGDDIDQFMRPSWLRWIGVKLTRIDKRARLHESYAECGRVFDRLRAVLDAQSVSKLIADL